MYVWNEQISLAIAEKLKEIQSDRPLIIIAGGPQVPDIPNEFMLNNPFIDICVHNEGEEAFLNIMEGL